MTRQKNLAVIDLETSGFSKTKNAICEIGILIINPQKEIIAEFCSYIKPYERRKEIQEEPGQLVSYKEDAMAVNGIDLELLENAPEAEDVAKLVVELLDQYNIDTLVGHNVKSFDLPWLNEFLGRFAGKTYSNTIDTLDLSKKKIVKLENYKLPTVCKFYGIINEQEHRAIGDCRATLELYINLEK